MAEDQIGDLEACFAQAQRSERPGHGIDVRRSSLTETGSGNQARSLPDAWARSAGHRTQGGVIVGGGGGPSSSPGALLGGSGGRA